MEFRLQKLGPTAKKAIEPVCCCCGYEAEWLMAAWGEVDGVEKKWERMFCAIDMRDAWLDAMNFNTLVPDSFVV